LNQADCCQGYKKTFFFVMHEMANWAWVFDPGKHPKPSLTFKVKLWAYKIEKLWSSSLSVGGGGKFLKFPFWVAGIPFYEKMECLLIKIMT